MVARGSTFDSSPDACPFIALELDRDRRSERPDYRHRCYAEQVPAPRTIAHQERYCLSPNFAGCPIFQDWALRAAARPVPLPPGYEGRRGPADARAAAAAATAAGAAASAGDEQGWPDSMDAGSAAAASAAVDSDAGTGGTQQLGAFDAPPQAVLEEEPHASPAYQDSTDEAASPAPDADEPALAEVEPIPPAAEAAAAAAAEADASPDDEPDALDSVAPMPAFLAARSARPNQPPPKVDDKITREEVVPSWELTDRYGAQSGGGMRDHVPSSDGAFSKILTAVAVVIILAIGVAAVVLIPGLLNGPAATTRPTLALASRTPSSTVVAGVATPTAAAATPTATAQSTPEVTPGPTPRTYRVKSGDTLAKIARRFRITVPALVAANPELTNADHIEVGQVLIIPPRQPN